MVGTAQKPAAEKTDWSDGYSKTVSFFSMGLPAYTEIKSPLIPFSLSNSTSKVAHFLTTIFGSIYHDREQMDSMDLVAAILPAF